MGTDNSDITAKIAVRRFALEVIGSPRVLDLCAGEGVMFKRVWKDSTNYLGIDKRFSRGEENGICWKGDHSRLLGKAMEMDRWNIIDIDAYSNPWLLARKVLKRIETKEFAMTLTCGIKRGLGNGKTSGYIRRVSGTNGFSDTRLLIRWYDDVIRWILSDFKTIRDFEIQFMKRITSKANPMVTYWVVKGVFDDHLRAEREGARV